MRTQPSTRILANHTPQDYYELWANKVGLDLTRYPFMKMDLAEANRQNVPFAVWDFDYAKDRHGQKLGLVLVTYKALFSKHQFTVQAYL